MFPETLILLLERIKVRHLTLQLLQGACVLPHQSIDLSLRMSMTHLLPNHLHQASTAYFLLRHRQPIHLLIFLFPILFLISVYLLIQLIISHLLLQHPDLSLQLHVFILQF